MKRTLKVYCLRPRQIENEAARVSHIKVRFVYVRPHSNELRDVHEAKLANVMYHLRYFMNIPMWRIQKRLVLSEQRIMRIITKYPWWPGCG